MALVYLLTNTVNGRRYVGKTKGSLAKRWYKHVYTAKSPAAVGYRYVLCAAMRKHGQQAFTRDVLGEYATEEDALLAEADWIIKLGTLIPDGYNMTAGGRGTVGYAHTTEDRERMRAIAIANGVTPSPLAIQRSKEVRAAGLSPAAIANLTAAARKHRAENPTTPEFIATCSAAQHQRRAAESAAGIVRTQSAETIAKRVPKLIEAHARRKAAGTKLPPTTDEFRAKMAVINGARARAKPVRTDCIGCNVTLTTSNAMPSKTRLGLNLRCRACEAAKQSAWHAAHPGYEAERARKRRAAATKT